MRKAVLILIVGMLSTSVGAACGDQIAPAVERALVLPMAELTVAVIAGDEVAQNELGRRYGIGKVVEKDSARAFALYELSAKQGLCDAQTNLGFMFMNGEGVAKDIALAKHWYAKAADQGNVRAEYSLGYIAATIDKDGLIAEKRFLAAAERGYLPAQRALISLYEMGELVPRNPAAATLWLHRVRDGVLLPGGPWRKP